MSINANNDPDIPIDTDVYYEYYEALAGQEELYLEETQEEVRAILASYDPSTSQNNRSIMIEICEQRVLDLRVKGSIPDATSDPLLDQPSTVSTPPHLKIGLPPKRYSKSSHSW